MANLKPIEPPEGTEFSNLPTTSVSIDAYMAQTDKKLTEIEQLTKYILWVGLISLVAVVVAVASLIVDQVHFNNQTYQQNKADRIQLLQDEINNLKVNK